MRLQLRHGGFWNSTGEAAVLLPLCRFDARMLLLLWCGSSQAGR